MWGVEEISWWYLDSALNSPQGVITRVPLVVKPLVRNWAGILKDQSLLPSLCRAPYHKGHLDWWQVPHSQRGHLAFWSVARREWILDRITRLSPSNLGSSGNIKLPTTASRRVDRVLWDRSSPRFRDASLRQHAHYNWRASTGVDPPPWRLLQRSADNLQYTPQMDTTLHTDPRRGGSFSVCWFLPYGTGDGGLLLTKTYHYKNVL